jgi:hypothetical protein
MKHQHREPPHRRVNRLLRAGNVSLEEIHNFSGEGRSSRDSRQLDIPAALLENEARRPEHQDKQLLDSEHGEAGAPRLQQPIDGASERVGSSQVGEVFQIEQGVSQKQPRTVRLEERPLPARNAR